MYVKIYDKETYFIFAFHFLVVREELVNKLQELQQSNRCLSKTGRNSLRSSARSKLRTVQSVKDEGEDNNKLKKVPKVKSGRKRLEKSSKDDIVEVRQPQRHETKGKNDSININVRFSKSDESQEVHEDNTVHTADNHTDTNYDERKNKLSGIASPEDFSEIHIPSLPLEVAKGECDNSIKDDNKLYQGDNAGTDKDADSESLLMDFGMIFYIFI
jgi:hypothetical protein